MPSTTTSRKIRELIDKLHKYQDEVQWTERDPELIKRTQGVERLESARKRMAQLQPEIIRLFKDIMGDVAGIEERVIQAKRTEQNKVDDEIKRILKANVDTQVAKQMSHSIDDKIDEVKRIVAENATKTAKEYTKLYDELIKVRKWSDSDTLKSIPDQLNNLRAAVRYIREAPVKIDIGRTIMDRVVTDLNEIKEALQIMNEEQDIWDIIYPATGAKKSVGAGTMTIDFYTGEVTLADGSIEHTSLKLENSKFDKVRSLSIETDTELSMELDSGGKYVVGANQLFSTPRQPFRIAYIHCTTTTSLKVYASTAEGIPIQIDKTT